MGLDFLEERPIGFRVQGLGFIVERLPSDVLFKGSCTGSFRVLDLGFGFKKGFRASGLGGLRVLRVSGFGDLEV